MAEPKKYRLVGRDGRTSVVGLTVVDGYVLDKTGKRLGKVEDFPDLQDYGDGKYHENPPSRVTRLEVPLTNKDGETAPEPPAEADTTRTSPVTGIVQSGKKLGLGDINGLFASLNKRGQMTAGELPSAGKFFSEALPTTPPAKEQNSELSADAPTPVKTGGNPENAEDGTSEKPDVADQIRQVRMHRNKRDQLEGFSVNEPFGGKDETKGNGMTASRRAAVSGFLDPNNKGYAAIRARDRAVGAFHQYDKGGMNIDGKVHMFNEGMSKDARFELSGNGIKSKDDAQAFLNKYVQGFGQTAPTDSPAEPPASEQTNTTLTPRNPSTAEKPSDPVIVDSTAPHPDTGRKPDAATEQSNKEYGQMQFRFDPQKNMMVPVK